MLFDVISTEVIMWKLLPRQAFNKDFMSHLAGGHGEEVYDDVTVGCLVQRHHIRYEHLKGLYGWKLNGDTSTIPNSEYKKSIRMRKPLPITFHYVDPKTIRAIHAEFDLLKNPNPVAGTEMSYQILGSLSSLKKNLRGVIGKEATHAVLTSLNKSIMDMMNNGGTGSAMLDSLNKTFADILGNGTGSAMFGSFNHSFSDFIGNGTNPAFFGSFNQSFTDFWGNGTGSAILGSFNHSLSDFIGNGTGSGILGSLNQSFTGFSGSGTSYRVFGSLIENFTVGRGPGVQTFQAYQQETQLVMMLVVGVATLFISGRSLKLLCNLIFRRWDDEPASVCLPKNNFTLTSIQPITSSTFDCVTVYFPLLVWFRKNHFGPQSWDQKQCWDQKQQVFW